MRCAKHAEHEAAGMCAYSGKPYCSHELVEVNGRMYGKDYLDKVFAEAKESGKQQQPMVIMNSSSASSSAAASVAVTSAKKPLNHALHIILTVCTGGLWLLVYVPLLLLRACG